MDKTKYFKDKTNQRIYLLGSVGMNQYHLFNIETGRSYHSAPSMNPEKVFGADEDDFIEINLPALELDMKATQDKLRSMLKTSGIKEGSAKAKVIEYGFINGLSVAYGTLPWMVICINSGRSLLTL